MKRDPALKAVAIAAVVFGLLTIFSGGRALFGDAQARAAVGNAVGFVLWFNFLAGFVYVSTGMAIWRGLRWGVWAAGLLAFTTALAAGLFGIGQIQRCHRGVADDGGTVAEVGAQVVGEPGK